MAGLYLWRKVSHKPLCSTSLLLYAGLVPTAVAYTLFFWGMRSVKASTASILTMLEPLTATLLAWVIFGERLATSGLIGAGLLLISVAVLYRGEGRTAP